MATIRVVNPRNINGTYTSPSVLVPSDLTGNIMFQTELTDDQFANTAKMMTFDVEVSNDNVNWGGTIGFTWIGGPKFIGTTPDYTRPGVGTNIAKISGKYVRIKVVTPSVLNVGLRIEYQ